MDYVLHAILVILEIYYKVMFMLAVRLPKPLEQRLSDLAEQTHRSKSHYVKQALEEFLEEHEAHLRILARFEKQNPRITLEQMEKNLGLED